MVEKSFYRSNKLGKLWAYLGILLMFVMNFGPFFSYLTFPKVAKAATTNIWVNETVAGENSVDADSSGGQWNSTVIDSNNHLHAAYLDNTQNDIKYAYFDGTTWTYTEIYHSSDANYSISIAVDSNNYPHITFYDETNERLKYIYKNGSGWQTAVTVDSYAMYGASLVLDASNCAHIAYYDAGYNLSYSYSCNYSSWTNTTLDSTGSVGVYPDIVLDTSGYPHISYYDSTNGSLKYIYKNASGWQATQTILSVEGKDAGLRTSIDLNSSNQPYISYYIDNWPTGSTLEYIYYNDIIWTRVEVDSFSTYISSSYWGINDIVLDNSNNVMISYFDPDFGLKYYNSQVGLSVLAVDSDQAGLYNSLALDSSGNPYIAYFDDANDDLRYAYKTGDTWNNALVDEVIVSTEVDSGNTPSMKIDGNNKIHVSHYNSTENALEYAYYDGSSWSNTKIDTSITVRLGEGFTTSLALDADNYPHIVYKDSADESLIKYAYKDGTGWHTETAIDYSSSVNDPVIDIDLTGYPHIAYYNASYNLVYSYKDGTGWHTATVDDVSFVGYGNVISMMLDGNNYPHIAYYDNGGDDLEYAYKDGTGWHQETVVSTGITGRYPSIYVDTDNYPHIAYHDNTNSNVEYSYKDGTGWHTETADSSYGYDISLIMSSSGYPRISYTNTSYDLKYNYKDDTGWHAETIDSTANMGYTTIALNSSQNVYIAYGDGTNNDLKVANKHVTFNDPATVDGNYVWNGNSLVIDSQNHWHVGYQYDPNNGYLKYAYYNGSSWATETVDNSTRVTAYNNNIAVNSDDLPRIVYYDYTNTSLKYAYKDGAGSWHKSTIENTADVGKWPAIAIDASNNVYVSYYDTTNKNLKYAYSSDNGTSWDIATVDGATDNVGEYTDIDLNSSNVPHISYYDSSNGALKHAYKIDGTWTTETVEDPWGKTVGVYSSIAIDSDNKIHIAHQDSANYRARYSYYNGTSWSTEEISDSVQTGFYTSIAVDSNKKPYVVYTDNLGYGLKYYYKYNSSSWVSKELATTGNYWSAIALNSSNEPIITYQAPSSDNYYDLKYISVYDTTPPSSTVSLDDYYSNASWSGSISGAATDNSSGVASVDITIRRSSDSKYWDGDSWETSTTWLAATGTTSWSYTFASTSFSENVTYTVKSRATDSNSNVQSTYGSDSFTAKYLWTKLDSNPVVSDATAKYPRVIKVSGTYRMWVEVGTGIIEYATSADGITWSVFTDCTGDANVHEPSVLYDANASLYKMWYNAAGGTKYRESSDGFMWGDEQAVTFDQTKAWDTDRITPYVFKDGSTYRMYYNANEGNGDYYIAYAYSSNGTSWTEPQNLGQVTDVASGTTNNNLVLKQGSSGSWEGYQSGEAMYSVYVLKNSADSYEMWYGANQTGDSSYKIGYASSTTPTDFTTSTKYSGNPVLKSGASGWDSTGVMYPNVIETSGSYQMWYTNNWNGKVGYATATYSAGSDTTAPTITSVNSDKTNGTYKAGEVIDIDVTFSEAVTSTGNVLVTLSTGGTCEFAVSNSTTGTCNYTVGSGQNSSDLTASTISGTIKDQSDNPMTNYAPTTNLAANKALVIDTTSPSITFTNDVAAGPVESDTIIITVSDTNPDTSTYEYGYSADATCNSDDTYGNSFTSGGSFTISSGTNNGKWICAKATDLAGNITYQASANDLNIVNTNPTITNVSSDKTNGAYKVGEVIDIDITFSEAVTSTGDVTVTLETGDTDRSCAFAVSNATTGTCNYTVQTGDISSDLTVKTIAGTIKDQSDNAMSDSSIPSGHNLADNKALVIDTTNPTTPATVYDGTDTSDDTYTSSTTQLSANWTASTDTGGSGINKYQYAIGTTAGATDVVTWTDNGTNTFVTKTDLTLSNGSTYYFTVRAVDNASNTGGVTNSDGITVDNTAPSVSLSLNDFYNSGNWPGSISGTAADAQSGIASDKITIQRSTDSKYWDGDSWETTATWLTATGTTSWSYTFASSNMSNGIVYSIVAKSTNGALIESSTATDQYMYNSEGWTKYPINPIRGYYNVGNFINNLFNWLMGDDTTLQVDTNAQKFYTQSVIMNGSVIRGSVSDAIILSEQERNKNIAVNLKNIISRDAFKKMDLENGELTGYGMWLARNNGIYLMVSPNGYDWLNVGDYSNIDLEDPDEEITSSPVMTLGTSGSFDDYAIFEPHVIWDSAANKYKMWYTGSSDANSPHIGYAESVDGITWTNRQQVMTTGSSGQWDYGIVRNPRVIKVSSTDYRMWYVGNGIKSPDAGWDSGWQIGYATSTDGITWEKYESNPVLEKGTNPDWDYANVWGMDVIKRGTNYEMFFSGNGADTNYKIGHAYSSDGVTWKEYDSNPIITGDGSQWDSNATFSPMVAMDEDETNYEMFYIGQSAAGNYNIGLATLDVTADTEKPESLLMLPSDSGDYYSDTTWMNDIIGLTYDTRGINKTDVQISYNNGEDTLYWNGSTWTTVAAWNETTPALAAIFWKYDLSKDDLTGGATYTVISRAADGSGNVETSLSDDSLATFTYDDTPPSTPAVSDGTSTDIDNVESLTTLSANWPAAIDAQSGIIAYKYAIGTTPGATDITDWTANGTSTSVTKNGLSLSIDQTYYFSVEAENGASTWGTAGNSDGQTVVDQTAPSTTLTTEPSSSTNVNTPIFQGTATDAMTNITAIQYRVDSGSWTSITAPIDGSYNSLSEQFSITLSILSEGSHTVDFRATDSKSNTATTFTSYTFTVDTTAPSSPTVTSPTNGSTIDDSTPTFSGTAEVNSTILLTVSSTPKSYSTTADSSGNWSYTMPDADALEVGSHSLEVKARDSAGNTSSATTISFTLAVASSTASTPSTSALVATGSSIPTSTSTPTSAPTPTPSSTTSTPSQTNNQQTSQSYLWLIIILIIGAGSGIWYWQRNKNK